MLKKIDKLGRIVIPEPFRKELGIELEQDVEMITDGRQITITNNKGMIPQLEIERVYNNIRKNKSNSEYDKGFEDALKFVLGKENDNNENR